MGKSGIVPVTAGVAKNSRNRKKNHAELRAVQHTYTFCGDPNFGQLRENDVSR